MSGFGYNQRGGGRGSWSGRRGGYRGPRGSSRNHMDERWSDQRAPQQFYREDSNAYPVHSSHSPVRVGSTESYNRPRRGTRGSSNSLPAHNAISSSNQSSQPITSSTDVERDLISFDDPPQPVVVSTVASVTTYQRTIVSNQPPPTRNYNEGSFFKDEDSRSESSSDGRSTASGTYSRARGMRKPARPSDTSSTTRSNTSIESVTQLTAQMSVTTIEKSFVPPKSEKSFVPPHHQYQEVVVAPKKAPAHRHDKEKVMLTTNFYPLEVRCKVVYRYDINVTLVKSGGPSNINLAKGPRDDAARTERNAFCLAALRAALETYRALREGQGYVYDGASILFSSDCLDFVVKAPLVLKPEQLPPDVRRFLSHYTDVNEIAIEVTPCKDSASQFDISQFQDAQSNRDMAHLDRTWKQFFDMLTNQAAVSSGQFHNFGAGKLFSNGGRREDARAGQERVQGINKGIKFIEATNDPSRAVAALLLDSKIGQFFKSQNIIRTICEYMNWSDNPNMPFPFTMEHGKMNRVWQKVNELVKGLRLSFADSRTNISFVATGITEAPLDAITDEDVNGRRQSVLARFPSLNPHNARMQWPAVVVRSRIGGRLVTIHYPMDVLMVSKNQRVPKFKLDDNPPRADKPAVRFRDINRLMGELNLHEGGRNNHFLRAFGVTLSDQPLRIEGIRRQRPSIVYKNGSVPMDPSRASWKIPTGQYKAPATADTIIIAWSCSRVFAEGLRNIVGRMLYERGVQVHNWEWLQVDTGCGDLKMAMDKLFAEIKEKKSVYGSRLLVFYVDSRDVKSHGLLKFYERRHEILTQHISQEVAIRMIKQGQAQTCSNIINKLNCKLTGLNHSVVPDAYTANAWITDNKSLIIGYDVAHPPPQIRADILDKKPPLSPSVVGISFNGGPHSESFIGDFHYQEPRKEEVSDNVLIARMGWIMKLYMKNRGQLPQNIFIIRDGVSEGQYQMTLEREMGAIRQGVEEWCNANKVHDYKPKYVCVVVTKRHNARFVKEGPQGIDNPLPGTVVDRQVTRNDMTEFYMQSHRVLQGTGKAPSYVVLVDELNLSMDELQSFLLALCFNHQIFEGSISLPEPVYQADEWAKRGNDIWKAYDEHYNLFFCKDKGDFSAPPVDFERMTKTLSYWKTSLEECRVNA